MTGTEINLAALADKGNSGVANDDVLSAFAQACLATDDNALTGAREALAKRMGTDAVADSAAIVATFQKMTRVADCTGIPLDPLTEMASRGIRDEIGANGLTSARNTPTPRLFQRVGARVLAPLLPVAMKLMTRLPKRWLARVYRL